MKVPVIKDFTVLVGIDWADKKHDVCEHVIGTSEYNYSIIFSKPESLQIGRASCRERVLRLV